MAIIRNPVTVIQEGETYSGSYTVTENGVVPCSNKRMLSDLTVEVSGGGSGAELNIAYSDTPPIDTSKLWVKQATPAAKVIAKQNIAGFVLEANTETMSATTNSSPTCCAVMGTDIYAISGKRIDKYDTLTDTTTAMSAKFATILEYTSCAAVGTDIYVFGGNTTTSIRKYDTLTDTTTAMSAKLVSTFYGTSCAAVGTDIYIFGGRNNISTSSICYNTIQKYDTLANTTTTMSAKLASDVDGTSCATVGTDIYIFGGSKSSTYYDTIQKYDTLTDTRTTMSATLAFAGSYTSCAAVGTDIYIFGGSKSSTYYNAIQKYDTLTDTITTMSAKLANAAYRTSCAAVGTDIYIFGGYSGDWLKTIQCLIIELSLTQNNLLLTSIYNGKEFKLVNSDTAEISFNANNAYIGNSENKAEFVDAYVYTNGVWVNVNTDEELPTYTTEANDYGETAIAQAYTTEENEYGQTAILTYGG